MKPKAKQTISEAGAVTEKTPRKELLGETYDHKRLKVLVRTLYDLQEQRISHGLRNGRENFALKDEDSEQMNAINGAFTEVEKIIEKQIKQLLKKFNVYTMFLKDVYGIGHLMASVLISEFNIYDQPAPEGYGLEHDGAYLKDGVVMRMRTAAQFWAYAGLHTIIVQDKETGNPKHIAVRPIKGEKINYNPWLRSKLLGVIGTGFIKLNAPYREYYDARKAARNAQGWGESDLHRHRDAIRFMMKCFVMDLFYKWREIEGLPVRRPYAIEKLGMTPAQAWLLEKHPGFTKKKKEEVTSGTEEHEGSKEAG